MKKEKELSFLLKKPTENVHYEDVVYFKACEISGATYA